MKNLLSLFVAVSVVGVVMVSSVKAATNDWFDAGISSYDSWPSDNSDKAIAGQGTWSDTRSATLVGSAPNAKLAIDTAALGQLAFAAEATVDAAASNAFYSATMTFSGDFVVLADISELATVRG